MNRAFSLAVGLALLCSLLAPPVARSQTSGIPPDVQLYLGQEYPTATPGASPNQAAYCPDGALWFTETAANAVGTLPAGGNAGSEIRGFTTAPDLAGIACAPDNTVWVAESGVGKIGRIQGGTVTEFTPPWSAHPLRVVATSTHVYFSDGSAGDIGAFDPATDMFQRYSVGGYTFGLAPLPDGNLLFTNRLGGVGFLNVTTGRSTTVDLPNRPANGFTSDIAVMGGLGYTSVGTAAGAPLFLYQVQPSPLLATQITGPQGLTGALTSVYSENDSLALVAANPSESDILLALRSSPGSPASGLTWFTVPAQGGPFGASVYTDGSIGATLNDSSRVVVFHVRNGLNFSNGDSALIDRAAHVYATAKLPRYAHFRSVLPTLAQEVPVGGAASGTCQKTSSSKPKTIRQATLLGVHYIELINGCRNRAQAAAASSNRTDLGGYLDALEFFRALLESDVKRFSTLRQQEKMPNKALDGADTMILKALRGYDAGVHQLQLQLKTSGG